MKKFLILLFSINLFSNDVIIITKNSKSIMISTNDLTIRCYYQDKSIKECEEYNYSSEKWNKVDFYNFSKDLKKEIEVNI